jgi:hypothetical protein
VFPGNAEVCDGRDNNCNGQVDEGLESSSFCTDADGDGHGVLGKGTVVGCTGNKGFGTCDNDCNDSDPQVFPGAVELCNNKDDNCDGKVDEGARPTCGLGWCTRAATDCSSTCVPGPPMVEVCNNYDDDCDGVKDNGTNLQLCGDASVVCSEGRCVGSDGGGAAGNGSPGGGSASMSNGGSTTNSGSTNQGGDPNYPPSQAAGTRSTGEAPPAGCSVGHRVATPAAEAGLLLVLAAFVRRRRRLSSRTG